MNSFRFAIMGAGNIANKFCDAVKRIEGASVVAVASKSAERAQKFAKKQGIAESFGNYYDMLEQVKPDCVYIATTPESHFALCMLCAENKVPIICEKAMFANSQDAEQFFEFAENKGVFAMEAMWSRFLPANVDARRWLREGKIGDLISIETAIGFDAGNNPEVRFLNPRLCGGATTDITVYGYELTTWMADREVKRCHVEAVKGETGVDIENTILLAFEGGGNAVIKTSIASRLDEKMVIQGTKGKIVIPHPHYSNKAYLYHKDKKSPVKRSVHHTPNGFVFEIEEAMMCISEGKIESDVIPRCDTLECARVFDKVYETMEC